MREGGSKAVWNFSENSPVLVCLFFPYSGTSSILEIPSVPQIDRRNGKRDRLREETAFLMVAMVFRLAAVHSRDVNLSCRPPTY